MFTWGVNGIVLVLLKEIQMSLLQMTKSLETESSFNCFTNPLWASVSSPGNGHKIGTSSVIVRMKRNNFIYSTYMQILEETIWNCHFLCVKKWSTLAISRLKWLTPVSAINPTFSLSPHGRKTFGGEWKSGQNTIFHMPMPMPILGSSRVPCMSDSCNPNRSHSGTWNSYHIICQLHLNWKIALCLAGHSVSFCVVVILKIIWVFGTSTDSYCTATEGLGGVGWRNLHAGWIAYL